MAYDDVKFYEMVFGQKQHPLTFEERGFAPLEEGELYPGNYRSAKEHQLLVPGDVFACPPHLIERPKSQGGWQDRKTREVEGMVEEFWIMDFVKERPDATEEVWTLREEPSMIIGINITERQYAKRVAQDEADEHVIVPSLAAAATQPPQGTRGGRNPVADAAGPPRVRR